MEILAVALTVLASLAAALLSYRAGALWLRALVVVLVAYAASYLFTGLSTKFSTDDQRTSWEPLLRTSGFYCGAIVGVLAAALAHFIRWLGRRRGAS